MADTQAFSFKDSSVAATYNDVLVPLLFAPWAKSIVEDNGPWEGRRVLDVATGTGIFASIVARAVGPEGAVTGVDINKEMLALAKEHCENTVPRVQFIESSAQSMDIPGDSMDFVACQQGFQFFSDKDEAAREMHRVLCEGGKVYVSTWRTVEECEFFGAICGALDKIGEGEISEMMRLPFDYIDDKQLEEHFKAAGCKSVQVLCEEKDLMMDGGVSQAIEVAYATPIRPRLLALSEQKQDEFRNALSELLNDLSPDGKNMGRMVANVLVGQK